MNRRFHPEFESDLISAAVYYEKQRQGLGAELIDEVESAIETIGAAPERWPVRVGGVRRFLVPRFPYVIRYRLATADATIQLSVLHGSRDPHTGRERE